jgi:hypothetical protein
VAAHYLLVDQQQVQREARVREKPAQAHELREGVLEPASPRRSASPEDGATLALDADDPGREGNRVDQPDEAVLHQPLELLPERAEAARLDLDQQVAADEIDLASLEWDLGLVAGLPVPVLEGGVKGALIEGGDVVAGWRRFAGHGVTALILDLIAFLPGTDDGPWLSGGRGAGVSRGIE